MKNPGRGQVRLRNADGAVLELCKNAPPVDTLEVEVDRVDTVLRELRLQRADGMIVVAAHNTVEGRRATVVDPDDRTVELYTRRATPHMLALKPWVTRRSLDYAGRFSAVEMATLRGGRIPEDMDDKWFGYYADDALFFHRSWTGEPVFGVGFATNEEGGVVTSCEVSAEPRFAKYTTDRQVALLSWLMRCDILGQDVDMTVSGPTV